MMNDRTKGQVSGETNPNRASAPHGLTQSGSQPPSPLGPDPAAVAVIVEQVLVAIDSKTDPRGRRRSDRASQRRREDRSTRLSRDSRSTRERNSPRFSRDRDVSLRDRSRPSRSRDREPDRFHEDLRWEYRKNLYKSLALTVLLNVLLNWAKVVAWWNSSFVPQLEPYVLPAYLYQFDTWSVAADATDVVQAEITEIDSQLESAVGDKKASLLRKRVELGQELTQLQSTAAFYRGRLDEYDSKFGRPDLTVEVMRERARKKAPVILD
ncbi:MAG: hypothetical protein U0136_13600 [Bdellovibrionota bacterium]